MRAQTPYPTSSFEFQVVEESDPLIGRGKMIVPGLSKDCVTSPRSRA